MDNIITPVERGYLSKRYRLDGLGPETTIEYAVQKATEYANTHAGNAPEVIRTAVSRLFIRFFLERDDGERLVFMRAIDRLIEVGRGVVHANRD